MVQVEQPVNKYGSKGYKSIICLLSHPLQSFAEVPMLFAINFGQDLGSEWTLIDPKNQAHTVKFELCFNIPIVSDGWESLRSFYGLTGFNWCMLKYAGQSVFDMVVYDDKVREISYQNPSQPPPAGHAPVNLPLNSPITYSCYFTKFMSESKIRSCQMGIPKSIGLYVCERGFGDWFIRGPTGVVLKCKINAPEDLSYFKLGAGWRKFCTIHNVKPGDMLSFFISEEPNRVIDVFIHNNQ